MGLLYEYAITPDVFDTSFYPHNEVATARIEYLKDVFLEEALVRNLRNGEWSDVFKHEDRQWHRRGKELLKKISKQNRFRIVENALLTAPANDTDWCQEALASHDNNPLTGVISTAQVVNQVGCHTILGRIDRLGSSPCWTRRSSSIRLLRYHTDYVNNLRLIMNCANSVMLIDPHLDPSQKRYSHVLSLLLLAHGRDILPHIEIHRVIYKDSGKNREIIDSSDWEKCFRDSWSDQLAAAKLPVKVFIWDHFHDRYLISDIIGIAMTNGYDTTSKPDDKTTWSRLSRKDRDDIQREFDPASNAHKLMGRFVVPYK